MKDLKAFLDEVDGEAKDETFLEFIISALKEVDVFKPIDLVGFKVEDVTPKPSGGKRAFIARSIVLAERLFAPKLPVQPVMPNSLCNFPSSGFEEFENSSDDALQRALVKALKKDEVKVHIDVRKQLSEVSLSNLQHSCLPKGQLVDALASEGAALVKKGVDKPFVCVDLTKWLPHWCANSGPGEDEGAGVKLTMAQWGCAFDRYALGAAACGQLSYTAALAHKDICL